MNVGALVLAAGRAERFGADKRLASLPGGQRVLDATLAALRASGLPVMVCLAAGDADIARDLHRMDIDFRHCERSAEGMGATLAEGVGHISTWQGLLVVLADMPWIDPRTYQAVAGRVAAGRIVVPVHNGRRGHPVGFGREYFPALATLRGDSGARRLLDLHAADVEEVPVSDAAIHRDIDTPSDLRSSH